MRLVEQEQHLSVLLGDVRVRKATAYGVLSQVQHGARHRPGPSGFGAPRHAVHSGPSVCCADREWPCWPPSLVTHVPKNRDRPVVRLVSAPADKRMYSPVVKRRSSRRQPSKSSGRAPLTTRRGHYGSSAHNLRHAIRRTFPRSRLLRSALERQFDDSFCHAHHSKEDKWHKRAEERTTERCQREPEERVVRLGVATTVAQMMTDGSGKINTQILERLLDKWQQKASPRHHKGSEAKRRTRQPTHPPS